jgi:hypothetical protein
MKKVLVSKDTAPRKPDSNRTSQIDMETSPDIKIGVWGMMMTKKEVVDTVEDSLGIKTETQIMAMMMAAMVDTTGIPAITTDLTAPEVLPDDPAISMLGRVATRVQHWTKNA